MVGIAFFENVLQEKFCKFLLNDSLQMLRSDRGVWTSNLYWNSNVVKTSGVVLVRAYDDILTKLILGQLLKHEIVDHENYHVMNYVWTKLSYIPWHDDDHKQSAVTIYLNEDWNEDWGGIFLFKDDRNEIRGHVPKFNTAVKNDAAVMHATTIISTDAEMPRITIQLFSRD